MVKCKSGVKQLSLLVLKRIRGRMGWKVTGTRIREQLHPERLLQLVDRRISSRRTQCPVIRRAP
jgi:hypothetical protein